MLHPTRPIHQCHTRSKNPFTIFEEDEEPDKPSATTNTTIPGQLPLQATVPPYDPCVQEMLDQPQQGTRAIHDLRPQCRAAPTATPTIHPSPTICPRSKPTQTFTPTILPRSKPTKNATLLAGPAYIQPDYDERDDHCNPQPNSPPIPRDAIRFLSPRGPANIAVQSLYHVINLAFNAPPTYTVPRNLVDSSDQFRHTINIVEVCNGVIYPITKETITKYNKLMNDPALKDLWVPAMSKELHRLAQGKENVTVGTNTIFFLLHAEIQSIPKDHMVMYACIVINHRPQKNDPNRIRITVGGNLINYPYKLTTRTANMVSTKIMWNSMVSTPGAKFGGADIKNMYLETLLDQYEYMQMPLSLFPNIIITHYNLLENVLNGFVYMENCHGMYGLPQAGIVANKLLKTCLARHGYFEVPHTPGLWKHISRPVWFNLCVDDFGAKYIGDNNLKHFFASLQKETYDIVEYWKGSLYCGITLDWNYAQRYVDIDMSKYVRQQLVRYAHPTPAKPQHCPYTLNPITYGMDNQAPTPQGDSPLLDAAGKKSIQQIVGSFLYYARAVNPTILMALFGNRLPAKQPHRRDQRKHPPIS
jgi:hypothetical protein